jgi:hypothetical protein
MSSSIYIYLQYKLRTGYVLSWLVSTALTTDCPKSLLPSGQSQSRPIPTTLIVPIAEWIEQSDQTCHVPRSVLNDLGQAIDLELATAKPFAEMEPSRQRIAVMITFSTLSRT